MPVFFLIYKLVHYLRFNPKRAGKAGTGGGGQFDSPSGFSKNVSSKERVKPWFFVTFLFFPENSLSILAVLINFPQFLEFFDITLSQRN